MVTSEMEAEIILSYNKKKENLCILKVFLLHETSGIRTPDNLIKSQVLYRLS